MQKWLQDANIPSKIILDSAVGYVSFYYMCMSVRVHVYTLISMMFQDCVDSYNVHVHVLDCAVIHGNMFIGEGERSNSIT